MSKVIEKVLLNEPPHIRSMADLSQKKKEKENDWEINGWIDKCGTCVYDDAVTVEISLKFKMELVCEAATLFLGIFLKNGKQRL